ncbi:hypothetical protein FZD51_03760 [Bacillus infantis]|uniref:Uncharacterized protein n=2 Tax=Bacillus infantis TaxID=324767 RepID=A0A5D4RLS1_9BACI|nr:hypothetical protein FZD51_03760 [Bacillus infantis]
MKQYFEMKKHIINSDEEFIHLARLKKGRFKEFLEEFYPLYCFSQSRFCDGNSQLSIIIGNQEFDGSLIQPDGKEKRIEISSYIDGAWQFKDAQRINQRGYGEIRFGDTNDLESRALEYLEKIIVNIKKKSKKNYTGTTMLFVVDTTDYFEAFYNSSTSFIERLKQEVRKIDFLADEIYLLVLNDQDISQINQNIFFIK